MKGFSRDLEIVLNFSLDRFNKMSIETFAKIIVEPVPSISDAPIELLTASFLRAAAKRHKFHQERKEREKKR